MNRFSRSSRATGPKMRGAARVRLLVDQHHGVVVEPDVGTVRPAALLRGADDDGLHHLALLHAAARQRVLDGAHDDVADARVPPTGAAEHADAQDLLGPRVVRDLAPCLLLDHLLGPLHDLDDPPALALRQRAGSPSCAPCPRHAHRRLVVHVELEDRRTVLS